VGAAPTLKQPIVVNVGTIEQVNATGADGGITWTLTYVPLDNGASVTAA
jgi:flagella basal body P-ring formation protein FlgA